MATERADHIILFDNSTEEGYRLSRFSGRLEVSGSSQLHIGQIR
jgi:hypothetical protein